MDLKTISFRLPSEKRRALDAIVTALHRDRSYVLNEAIDAYLEVQQRQIEHIIEHIKEGLRQADADQFASSREVSKAFARWRKRGTRPAHRL